MNADWRIAVDIGGTFTDVALLSPDGALTTAKVASTPDDYAAGVLDGIEVILQRAGLGGDRLGEVLHASTVATNAILQGTGARTALLTTAGFRDVLELRRIRVPRLYEPLYRKPPPLVPRRHRYEVAERMGPLGEVLVPLDTAAVARIAALIAASDLEAVAVCFLHSYANPAHERAAGEILRRHLPGRVVSLSVDVLPEIREYERTSTTVINAYVAPVVTRYLNSLRHRLDRRGIAAPLLMMQSSGGILDLETVIATPAQVVESGPAAGVIAAAFVAARMGLADVITLDIGGTTAKASLIEGGRHATTDEYEVGGGISLSSRLVKGGGYALKLPVIDISEVGAGGGSLVSVDAAGMVRVGPASAGATPGPACYGRGGTRPTVTDAHVVLGNLNPHAIAAGGVAIDPAAAARAIVEHVAQPLGRSVTAAASGIVALANASMMRAVRAVTTLRGRDPADFALLAFGGGGGLHAVGLARSLGIATVIVPPGAGVFSALGLLCADIQLTVTRAFLRSMAALDAAALEAAFAPLEHDAVARLGGAAGETIVRRTADLRYAGQAFELPVALAAGPLDLRTIAADFDAEHERSYGHRLDAGYGREIVALRVTVILDRPRSRQMTTSPPPVPPASTRKICFFGDEEWHRTPVITRHQLAAEPQDGPLVVEEADATIIVPPGARAHRDEYDNIVIAVGEDR